MQKSNLLSLCSNFTDMKFIIFTNLEDTPLDKHILTAYLDNVVRVVAANSVVVSDKVIPAPYGCREE